MNDRSVDDEADERRRFSSKILALWCRKSPKISEVLPLLDLHGLSSGDFGAAWEQFPAARHQRCWVHKARNIANCLPKSAQPGATKAMREIFDTEDRVHAEKAIEAFARTCGVKFPKAVARSTEDRDELPAFYDFPAEHWARSLRTTHPIESTFSTVKLRTKVTRGVGGPTVAPAAVFELVESVQARWRAITGARLVFLVRAGARFENGVLVGRPEAA